MSPPPTGGPSVAATTTNYFVSDLLAPNIVLRAPPASSRHPQYPELADASVTSGAETRWISGLQSSSQLRAEPPGPRCGHSVLHPVSSALSPYNRPSSLRRKDPDRPQPGSVQQTLRSSYCVPDALLGVGDPLQTWWTCSRADRCSPTGRCQDGGVPGDRRDTKARAAGAQPCPASGGESTRAGTAASSGFLGLRACRYVKNLGEDTAERAALGIPGGHLGWCRQGRCAN